MWIHRICDYYLTEEVFQNFGDGINGEYLCMLCRQDKRKKYIEKIIKIAEKKDQRGWFNESYENDQYKRIIKNPMFFTKMRQNIDKYLVNVQMLKDHFDLIFTNAYNYNKPKERPYKDAEVIHEFMRKLIERKWDGLVMKQDMSIEEQHHQKWITAQIAIDPDFLEKSEDIEVPPKKFKFIPPRFISNLEEVSVKVHYKVKDQPGSNIAPSVVEQNESDKQSSNDAVR